MSNPDRDPLELLVDDFVSRLRRHEQPAVETYAARHPALAEEIRNLFPAVIAMEQFRSSPGEQEARLQDRFRAHPPVLGDFRVLREVGRGGMGIVYEAEQISLERRVALKILPRHVLCDAKHLRRFQREARTAAKLHHTNIVPIFGVGHHEGLHFFVMQFIDGMGLDKLIARARAAKSRGQRDLISATEVVAGDVRDGQSHWKRVAKIGAQVAEALHYAHQQGTLHRDIKPANLLIDQRGVVWVTDFGLARATEHSDISQTNDLVGTLHYMAPERFAGCVDARSDIYGLGLTLYELATCRPGFEDADRNKLIRDITTGQLCRPRSIDCRIPRDLETIILKATCCEPDHRYATAGALLEDLRNFAHDRPIQARRISSVERAWRWGRRNRAVAGLALTAMLLLVLVAVITAWSYVRTRRALTAETSQRHRAEATSELALEVIDKIYDQFAPYRTMTAADLELDENEQETPFAPPAQPVLSDDVATLLENMLGFYARLAEQQGIDETTFRGRVAGANGRVGDIRQRLGDFDRAADAYQRALDIYRRLETADTTDVAVAQERARMHNELGNVYRRSRRWRAAYQAYADALKILQPLARAPSSGSGLQFELARTHYLLGRHGRRFRPGRLAKHGSSGKRSPGSFQEPSRRRVQPVTHESPSRGSVRSRDDGTRSEPRAAWGKRAHHHGIKHYEAAIAILESLDELSELTPDGRHLLARCYRDRALHLHCDERPAAQRMAITLLESLVEEFPDVADYRFGLGQTYLHLGRRAMRSEQEEERELGQRHLRFAREIVSELVAEHPQVTDYRTTLAYTYHLLARDLVRRGRVEDAEMNFRRASDVYDLLIERHPEAHGYVFGKCWCHIGLATLLRDRQAWEEAQQLLDASARAVERMLTSDETKSARHPFGHRLLESVYRTKAEGFAARQQTTAAMESRRIADFHAQQAHRLGGHGRHRRFYP